MTLLHRLLAHKTRITSLALAIGILLLVATGAAAVQPQLQAALWVGCPLAAYAIDLAIGVTAGPGCPMGSPIWC